MNSKILILGVAVALVVGLVQASENERGEYGERGEYSQRSITNSVVSVVYVEECSECHIAYSASMLPQRSWKKMMASLDDHFGENASQFSLKKIVCMFILFATLFDFLFIDRRKHSNVLHR